MSIRKAVPPNMIGNPNIPLQEQNRYEALIFNKGYKVTIENGVECPCKGRSGAPLTTCHNCLGLGWIFINPIETRAIITSANSSSKYKHWSKELIGTVNVTVRNEDKISYMDKITFKTATNILSEVRPLITVGSNKFVFCTYKIKSIRNIYIFSSDSEALIKVPATSYSIKSVNNQVIELSGIRYPTLYNGAVSVEYEYLESYNVIDIPHSFRSAFIDDQNGTSQEYNLPVQAIAAKSHMVMGGATNYSGDNIINNTYL